MNGMKNGGIGGRDELGRDMELAGLLSALDPAQQDPNYWFRFRSWVVESAGPELARRRLMAELTVVDVMSSWARAVLPTAVLAAAFAGLLLVRGAGPAPAPIGVEEMLVSDVEGETIPAALDARGPGATVVFASEVF